MKPTADPYFTHYDPREEHDAYKKAERRFEDHHRAKVSKVTYNVSVTPTMLVQHSKLMSEEYFSHLTLFSWVLLQQKVNLCLCKKRNTIFADFTSTAEFFWQIKTTSNSTFFIWRLEGLERKENFLNIQSSSKYHFCIINF